MGNSTRIVILVVVLVMRIGVGYWGNLKACPKGQKVRLSGKISEMYWRGEEKWMRVGGGLVKIEAGERFSQNDRVVVVGRCSHKLITRLSGRFVLEKGEIESRQEAEEGENGVPVSEKIHENIKKLYLKTLPANEAALAAGMVIGDDKALGKDFKDKLVNSGLIHLVVASGYNVALVIGAVMGGLTLVIKRKWAAGGALLTAIMYALVTGGEAPVVRSLLMAGLALLAKETGRKTASGWVLVVTLWLMVMAETAMLFSVSFQLSAAATAGLVWLEPVIRKRIEGGSWWRRVILRVELPVTLAAMAATLPLIWWHFGRVSLWGVVTNSLVLPVVGPVMVLGFMMIPAGLVFMPAAKLLAIFIYPMLCFVTFITRVFE